MSTSQPTHVAIAIVAAMREIKAKADAARDVTADEFDQLLAQYDELAFAFNKLPEHEREEALR